MVLKYQDVALVGKHMTSQDSHIYGFKFKANWQGECYFDILTYYLEETGIDNEFIHIMNDPRP